MSTVLLGKFTTELNHFETHLPESCRGIEVTGDNTLCFKMKFARPFDAIHIQHDAAYRTSYPHGAVEFLIRKSDGSESHAHGMPADSAPTLGKLAATFVQMARQTICGRDVSDPKSVADLFPLNDENSRADDDDEHDDATMLHRAFSAADRSGSGAGGGGHPRAAAAAVRRSYRDGSFWSGAASMSAGPNSVANETILAAIQSNGALSAHLDCIDRVIRVATGNSGSSVSIDTTVVGMTVSLTVCVPMSVVQSILVRRGDVGSKAAFQEMLAAYGLDVNEHVIFDFSDIDPSTFGTEKAGVVKLDVGQPSHFATGAFPGAAGQLQRLCREYLRMCGLFMQREVQKQQQQQPAGNDNDKNSTARLLMRENTVVQLSSDGFNEHDINDALASCFDAITAELDKPNGQRVTPGSLEQQLLGRCKTFLNRAGAVKLEQPPAYSTSGPFLGAIMTWITRLENLASHCALCDRIHAFVVPPTSGAGAGSKAAAASSSSSSSSGMPLSVASCCTRQLCQTRFQQLDVGRDIVSSVAATSGVIDLLVHAVRAAACDQGGSRAKFGLKPWPVVVDSSGKVVISGESESTQNLPLLQEILKNFPLVAELVQQDGLGGIAAKLKKHHPLAPSLFSWICTSCASTLIRVPKSRLIASMNTPFQFRVIQSPEKNREFEQLKKKHGAFFTWHGTPPFVLFSILNSGLQNMSLKRDGSMLHGNAAGGRGGTYMSSAHMSTSMGYSGVYAQGADTVKYDPSIEHIPDPMSKKGAAYHGQLGVIMLAECINHDFTSGSKEQGIVVQPNDDHVRLLGCFVWLQGTVSPPGNTEGQKLNMLSKDFEAEIAKFVQIC